VGLRFKGLKFKVCDAFAAALDGVPNMVRGDTNHGSWSPLRWMEERSPSNLAHIFILFLGVFVAPRTTAFSI
jgi:hypothetical protein